MKPAYLYYSLFSLALLMSSCIDEYNADLPSTDQNRLVVEGHIRSDMTCTFSLSQTRGLSDESWILGGPLAVFDARLSVVGEDGTVFPGTQIPPGIGFYITSGTYQVQVGTLRPDVRYWLRIETQGDVFTSDPQYPLDADPIDLLSYEQSRPDQEVDIMVTSAAPADNQVHSYRWDCDQYWEIYTPYKADYEYNPQTDSIYKTVEPTNHGWCKARLADVKMGKTSDFQQNRIEGMPLFSIKHTDNRLNTRYTARVYQRRITPQEYEYETLRNKLTNEMGGLFTPMPADLPTNIHCEGGSRKAIGYVGVSGRVTSATLTLTHSEVKYERTRIPEQVSHGEMFPATCRQLYNMGYRLVAINNDHPSFQGDGPFDAESVPNKKWALRWCVDCTDSYWGASLIKPSDWPE